MAELYLRGRRAESIFQLLGENENGMSASLGWALAKSPEFRKRVLTRLLGAAVEGGDARVLLQESECGRGITDIEIDAGRDAHIIIEAKRGWSLPGREQLEKYAGRARSADTRPESRLIVTVSNHDAASALTRLREIGCETIAEIRVTHLSWRDFYDLSRISKGSGTLPERRLLAELGTYLKGIIGMANAESNWVYVVSLSDFTPDGWGISWKEIVTTRRHYFHPAGGGWPTEQPNYLAFRYDGRLQSIHHVKECVVLPDVHSIIGEIPEKAMTQQRVYRLGPAFGPVRIVKSGPIWDRRVWCMLDTLFTSATIEEACAESRNRKGLPHGS